MPTKAPSEPMMASQPCRTAASTPILTGASPITARRARPGAPGTVRSTAPRRRGLRRPARPAASAPSTAIETSEPVAKIETCALPSRRRNLVGAGDAACCARRACGEAAAGSAASAPARSACRAPSSASCQHSSVSTASQGRNTLRFGIARSAARCSTGWCVGPSSPRPMESCVMTWMTRSPISAASRIDGRQ